MQKQKIFEKFIVAIFIAGLFFLGLDIYSKSESDIYPVEVTFFDVGQGDASMIKVGKDKELLIDAGPNRKISEELGKYLIPTDNEIEAVIISHMHADHISGLNYLIKERKINEIFISDPDYSAPDAVELISNIKKFNIKVTKIERGTHIDFYGVNINTLWPESGYLSNDLNNNSVIFTANFGGCNYFFPGDASAEIQEGVINNIEKINILKVSHHGSKTGTSENIIKNLNPDYIIISVGKNNQYRHPSKFTTNLLLPYKTFRTDINGTIKFGCDGKNNLLIP